MKLFFASRIHTALFLFGVVRFMAVVTSKSYFNFWLNILKMLCFPVLTVSKVKFP